MKNVSIRVMTRDFELITDVDGYSSLQITRSWHGVGMIELRINRYLKGADELLRGRIIFPHSNLDKAYQIKYREIELDENGKQSEDWIIRALSLKSWFGQRLTYPPEGASNDKINADAESVMRHYASNNLINPVDAKRRMDDVVLAANKNRGPSTEWQSRYKNLAEELAEISMVTGLGWNVDIDYANSNFPFKVLEGRDLTTSQNVLPPAIFSPEFGTLKSMSYLESELNYQNHAVVAGQGEGAERKIVEVGESEGVDRYELFVDARDIADQTEGDNPVPRPPQDIESDLINRGIRKLAEHEQEIYLEGQALTLSRGKKIEQSTEIGLELGETVNVESVGGHVVLKPAESYFISPYQPVPDIISGSNTIGPIDISRLGSYAYSKLTYATTTPAGTSVLVQISLDNTNWQTIRNGESLPLKIGELLINKKLYIRQLFITENIDVVPRLTSFELIIRGYTTSNQQVFTAGFLEYGKDFDLGDIVTLQNKEWGVTLDTRITEIKEIYEPGKVSLELTFGKSRPDLISKIKQELSGMKSEITR